jgi:hypothetical protein
LSTCEPKETTMKIGSTVAQCFSCGLLLPLFVAGSALATTHHVGTGESIGDALAVATAGDSVVVACGTYVENGLSVPNGVVLTSASGFADCVTIATIGGEPILTCAPPATLTQINGLTLAVAEGGFVTPVARGAGLRCDGASPAVQHCRFLDLEAAYGGAVYCSQEASPTFFRCEFGGNRAGVVGGALNLVGGSHPIVAYCLFSGNSTAIHVALGAHPRILGCTFVNNTGSLTGIDAGGVRVENSIIAAGGSAWSGDYESAPEFACTDIWGNVSDWSGWIAPQVDLSGNFAADPYFCGNSHQDAAWGLDETSPCAPGASTNCGLIGAFDVACSKSGVGEEPDTTGPPAATRLCGNRPNPFNPRTEIAFELRQAGPVSLAVYDLAGRLVRTLVHDVLPAGAHAATWDGLDRNGRTAAAGVYLIHLKADGTVDTRRVALVK